MPVQVPPPLLLDSQNGTSSSSETARHFDRPGSELLSGARFRRDALEGDRTAARPLSVCPTGIGANDYRSALKIGRRYSAIHLDGSASETFLRDYPAPVRPPETNIPAAPRPIKPSKSDYITKRYGMDFGPARRVFEPPPREKPAAYNKYWEMRNQEPEQTSPYSDNVSEDGSSTVYDSFDFPQPPPIASPLIRRMQSNFWLQDKHGYSQRLSQKQRVALGMEPMHTETPRASRSTAAAIDHGVDLWHQSQSSTSTTSSHSPADYLSRNPYSNATHDRENLARIGDMLFGENATTWPDSSLAASQSDDPRGYFTTHTSSSGFVLHGPPNIAMSQSTPIIHPQHSTSVMSQSQQVSVDRQKLGRLPRIIRKVASMRSDAQKVEQLPEQQPLAGLVGHGHRAIPKARSFRSIFRSSEADENQNRIPVFGASTNRLSWMNTHASVPSMAGGRNSSSSTRLGEYNCATGREGKAQTNHQGCYLPSGGDSQQLRDKRRSVNYAKPAPQQSTLLHHHWAAGSSVQQYPDASPTSFIDLSPGNRDSKSEARSGGKRERMKGFFSKTGSGLFGWGNAKKNKNDSK